MVRKIKGIYAIEFNDGIKIGISNDIETRLITYQSSWCKDIKTIHYIECNFPRVIERQVCDHFIKSKIKGSTEYIRGCELKQVLDFMVSLSNEPCKEYYYKRPQDATTLQTIDYVDLEKKRLLEENERLQIQVRSLEKSLQEAQNLETINNLKKTIADLKVQLHRARRYQRQDVAKSWKKAEINGLSDWPCD